MGRIAALRDRGLADNGDGCEGVYWGYLMPFLGSALLPNAYDLSGNATLRSASPAQTRRYFRRHAPLEPTPHVLRSSGRSTGRHTVWTRTPPMFVGINFDLALPLHDC